MCEVIISSSDEPTPESQPESPTPVWTWAIDRVSEVLTRPNPEFWEGLATEKRSNATVVFAYLFPLLLAAWGFRAAYIAEVVGWGPALLLVADSVVAVVVLSFVLGALAEAMAPRFGGERQGPASFRLFAFLQTPVLVAMVLEFLFSLAGAAQLGSFLQIAGLMYGVYLLWIGLPAFFRLGTTGNFIAFPMTIAIIWFLLRSLVMTGVGFAYQKFYGENLLQDTLDADYTLRSYSRDEMPQYQGRAHQIQLAEGMTYRFVFLARHNLSNIDLQITDSEGKPLAQDDPHDQNGSVMLDFTPESSGTYYMSTEVGDLGGPSVRTETLLYTFMKPTSSAP